MELWNRAACQGGAAGPCRAGLCGAGSRSRVRAVEQCRGGGGGCGVGLRGAGGLCGAGSWSRAVDLNWG